MQQYLKRALNILVLLIAYVRINEFSFLLHFFIPFTSRCAVKWIVLGRGSPYTLVHKVIVEKGNEP